MLDKIASASKQDQALRRQGRLELCFSKSPSGRTFLERQYSSYPFHICRPFYLDSGPTAGMASVYTQSSSGGIYSLDRLETMIEVGEGAQAQVTSQASTIVHKAQYGGSHQSCTISVSAGSLVEYLPEAVILFPEARLKSTVTVRLHENASAILFDSFFCHDPQGEGHLFAEFENALRLVTAEDEPLAIDRYSITGLEFAQTCVGRMAGASCHGSFIAVSPMIDVTAFIDDARNHFHAFDGQIGISRLSLTNGFSVRILAGNAFTVRQATLALWKSSRLAITGHLPKPRRK